MMRVDLREGPAVSVRKLVMIWLPTLIPAVVYDFVWTKVLGLPWLGSVLTGWAVCAYCGNRLATFFGDDL